MPEINRGAVCRHRFDVRQRRLLPRVRACRIGDGQPAIQGEPDPTGCVGDDTAMSFHALEPEKPVSGEILAEICARRQAIDEPRASDPHDVIRRRNPQRAAAVLCDAQNRSAQDRHLGERQRVHPS